MGFWRMAKRIVYVENVRFIVYSNQKDGVL